MEKLKELSVFFPLYNEEKNVMPLVDEAMETFRKVAETFEILLIKMNCAAVTLQCMSNMKNCFQKNIAIAKETKDILVLLWL